MLPEAASNLDVSDSKGLTPVSPPPSLTLSKEGPRGDMKAPETHENIMVAVPGKEGIMLLETA